MGVILDASAGNHLRALNVATEFLSAPVYPFSISFWGRRPDYSVNGTNVGAVSLNRGNSNSHFHYVAMRRGGGTVSQGRGQIASAGPAENSATGADNTAPENTWVHMVAVFAAADDRRLYQNGSGNVIQNTVTVNPTGIDSISLGETLPGTAQGVIHLAEVGIWDIALSTANIDALFTAVPSAVAAANLQHYYPLNGDFLDAAGSIDLEQVGTVSATADHPIATSADYVAPGVLGAVDCQGFVPGLTATNEITLPNPLTDVNGVLRASEVGINGTLFGGDDADALGSVLQTFTNLGTDGAGNLENLVINGSVVPGSFYRLILEGNAKAWTGHYRVQA